MVELIWNGHHILLPSPEFGNSINLHLGTVINQAMNGDYWTYISTPVPKTLAMSFNHLNRNKAIELESFIVLIAGQRILLKDHNDVVWSVRLLNPFSCAHAAIRNSQIQLEFEISDN